MVPRQGFEPRFLGPEPSVLPLDDLGMIKIARKIYHLSPLWSTRSIDRTCLFSYVSRVTHMGVGTCIAEEACRVVRQIADIAPTSRTGWTNISLRIQGAFREWDTCRRTVRAEAVRRSARRGSASRAIPARCARIARSSVLSTLVSISRLTASAFLS